MLTITKEPPAIVLEHPLFSLRVGRSFNNIYWTFRIPDVRGLTEFYNSFDCLTALEYFYSQPSEEDTLFRFKSPKGNKLCISLRESTTAILMHNTIVANIHNKPGFFCYEKDYDFIKAWNYWLDITEALEGFLGKGKFSSSSFELTEEGLLVI